MCKKVLVPQHKLDELEAARKELYDILYDIMDGDIPISVQVAIQNVSDPMWQLANTKWPEK